MERVDVVTCFPRHRGAVLLVRRADDAGTYPGRWGTITGYREHDDPVETARMELREETGLADADLVRAGEPFDVGDADLGREWRVHPFLFEVPSRAVTTNEEIAAHEWTSPTAILRRETVPALWESYDRVRPTADRIAADTDRGAAALSVAGLAALRDEAGLAAVEGDGETAVADAAATLLDARPSMAPLANRINRVMAEARDPAAVEAAADAAIERALEADETAAAEAADALPGRVLTLSRSRTVRAALLDAEPSVLVAESRPACEGREAAKALATAGLDASVCVDAAVPHLLAAGEVDAVLVGADTVLPDGRVLNKVGTRAAALAADREGVPFHAVAATDKVSTDPEPRFEAGDPAAVYDGDADLGIHNPTFDVAPADCVDGVFTERGHLDAGEIGEVAEELRDLAGWRER